METTTDKKVKITMQVNETTRKEWKQFCLDKNINLTTAIKKAMQDFIINESKAAQPATR